jgi:alkylation response protein AidB-like acyl-CoA dehydrogenase
MGTVSQFHHSARPPAHRIESEEEAIATARALAAAFRRQASERDVNRILPHAELDALSQSGLTAITVPPEYEGLDVSNALLAEIVAIVAEGDASIGQALESHFRVLEALRAEGGEELHASLFARALAGDRFAATPFADSLTLEMEALGYRLGGRTRQAPGILFSDWIAASAADPSGRGVTLYLARETEGLQVVDDWDGFGQRTNGTATVVVGRLHVNADAVAATPSADRSTASTLGLLLHAGTALGIARAALADLPDLSKDVPAAAGERAVRIELVAGALERAGRKLDIAQVNPTDRAMVDAYFSASAACIAAGEAALETASALVELGGDNAGSIALNLDRHWRNARIHALSVSRETLLRAAGDYHWQHNGD